MYVSYYDFTKTWWIKKKIVCAFLMEYTVIPKEVQCGPRQQSSCGCQGTWGSWWPGAVGQCSGSGRTRENLYRILKDTTCRNTFWTMLLLYLTLLLTHIMLIRMLSVAVMASIEVLITHLFLKCIASFFFYVLHHIDSFSARLWYLHCLHTGDTAVLH